MSFWRIRMLPAARSAERKSERASHDLEVTLVWATACADLTPPHAEATSAVVLPVQPQVFAFLNALQKTIFLLEIGLQEGNVI